MLMHTKTGLPALPGYIWKWGIMNFYLMKDHEFLFVAGGGIGGFRTSTHPTLAEEGS